MCGLQADDGVMIVASKNLFMGQLEFEQDLATVFSDGGLAAAYVGPISRTYTLTTKMGELTIAYGADYAEALSNLWKSWTPDRVPREEIGSQAAVGTSTPALGEGPTTE